jgi:nucleoside-diphosphate-sugar epimerase
VIVRPRFIWGRNDTANLIKFVDGLRSGRLRWIAGGRYATSTCHVANVVEGAILAAERGAPGAVYFLTDGEPVEFRWFLTEVLATQKLEAPKKSVPRWLARVVAAAGEAIWRFLGKKTAPPATRIAIALMGQEVTVSDARARAELGYQGKVTHERGLAEMAALPPVAPAA